MLSSLGDRQRGVSYGRDDARSEPADGLIPILRANNIDGDRLNFNDLVYVPRARVSENQKLRPGDVVIAMSSGSKSVVGKTAQIFDEWNGSFGAFCGVLRPHSEMDARYFGLFLRTREYRQAILELSAGTNINNLKAEHFDAIQVPIAPLAEQRRIVGKLELLLGKVSSSQQRLSRVPGLLKRFRQSVLAAACSGKLTADWRETPPEGEPVSEFIQRIFDQRKKRYDELSRQLISEGKKPPKQPANLSRQPIEPDALPDNPESWEWVRWNDLADWITYGFTRPMPHVAEGVPVVTAKNVRDGFLDYTDIDHTTPEAFAELSEKDQPRQGEILIT